MGLLDKIKKKNIKSTPEKINEPEELESYSGQFKLRIPKSLHKTLSEDSKKEGISMNQYCVYLLSKNSAEHHFSSR